LRPRADAIPGTLPPPAFHLRFLAFCTGLLLLRFRHTGDEFVTTFLLLPCSPLVHSVAQKRPASRFREKILKGSEMPVPTNQANPKRCSILSRNGQMTALSPPLAHPRFPCHPAPPPPRSTAPASNPSAAAKPIAYVATGIQSVKAPARFPHPRSKIHTAAPKRPPIFPNPTSNTEHPEFQTSYHSAPFGKSPARS